MGLKESYVAKWYVVHATILFFFPLQFNMWFGSKQTVRDGNGKLKQFVFCEYQCY
jgi:hypothetical protein